MTNDPSLQFIVDGCRQVVQLLAAPPDVALAYYPDGTVKADELALDFDNFGRAALENSELKLTEAQRESLTKIDQLLDEMTDSRQHVLWTEEAVRTHPKWRAVRDEARRALAAFAWPAGPDHSKRKGELTAEINKLESLPRNAGRSRATHMLRKKLRNVT